MGSWWWLIKIGIIIIHFIPADPVCVSPQTRFLWKSTSLAATMQSFPQCSKYVCSWYTYINCCFSWLWKNFDIFLFIYYLLYTCHCILISKSQKKKRSGFPKSAMPITTSYLIRDILAFNWGKNVWHVLMKVRVSF